MEVKSFDPVQLTAAIIDTGLGETTFARKARVGIGTVKLALKGFPVKDGAYRRIATLAGLPINGLPDRHRVIEEWELRDRTADQLRRADYDVEIERILPSGRKADIIASKNKTIAFIIEAKVKDPLAAIGQLIADRIELASDAQMVLLIRPDLSRKIVQQVCERMSIKIWLNGFVGEKGDKSN